MNGYVDTKCNWFVFLQDFYFWFNTLNNIFYVILFFFAEFL